MKKSNFENQRVRNKDWSHVRAKKQIFNEEWDRKNSDVTNVQICDVTQCRKISIGLIFQITLFQVWYPAKKNFEPSLHVNLQSSRVK